MRATGANDFRRRVHCAHSVRIGIGHNIQRTLYGWQLFGSAQQIW